MSIQDEIDTSFGTGPEEGPVHAILAEGHRALRRRRIALTGAAALAVVVVGGSAVFAAGGGTEDAGGRVFLHRGIAARQFQRAFVLAEGIDVKGAWLDSGLLHIDLARPQPEVRVRTIQIGQPGNRPDGAVVDGTPERG